MKKSFIHLAMVALLGGLVACGEGRVVATNEAYEPRIVIEGYLFPEQPVQNIKITRNFRIDNDFTQGNLAVENIEVKIIDEGAGREYELTRHSEPIFTGARFDYNGEDWLIEYGKTYTLEVKGTIDGQDLQARATTTVPLQGFEIAAVNHEELTYRPRDANDELIIFELEIERSPQTTSYVFTVRPLNPDPDLFIYDNPYEELDRQDVEEDLDDYNYSWDWIQNTPLTTGRSQIEIFWFELSFYGAYEVIVYAADKNFIDFLRTHGNVQEDDGNFHEPKFNIAGDGIGVFGAALADTVQIRVLRE